MSAVTHRYLYRARVAGSLGLETYCCPLCSHRGKLSRLGRSTLQILEIMKLAKEKGIAVHAVKGGWSLNGSLESKIVLTIFAMIAEIERDLISERTKEGLRAKKAAGITLGRPKGPGKSKLDKNREEIIALLNNGSTKIFIARKYGTSVPNLYNRLKKNNKNDC